MNDQVLVRRMARVGYLIEEYAGQLAGEAFLS